MNTEKHLIHVYCRTNLDGYKMDTFPHIFAVGPMVGDYVRSKDGYRLEICAITHAIAQSPMEGVEVGDPIIEVELM